ncbi:hypothetical protein [Bacillus sp. 165]|uniref:HesB/YadR/YfhF family protein n=1 Tax=Bacillus sp. 165 TaxID=1529117 RepID=UPI001ADCE6EC|nr:hypothetical protein [Bacillus sp. 165]MBO9129058.1 hypothetical protein [Bacillus sp. 165]
MKFSLSNEAVQWYKSELNLQAGDALRFYVQYGGCSTVQKGLSLGIRKDTPVNPACQVTEEGILFFVEEEDEWYFDKHGFSVTYEAGSEAPEFHYEK